MFGVPHICGVDGFSGKIVGFCSMPKKNCVAIILYESFYRYKVMLGYTLNVYALLFCVI